MAKWLIGLNSLRSFWQRFVRFSGVRAFCSERSRWRVIILESAFASPGIFCKYALLLGWVTVLSTKAALFWLWIHMDSVPFWQFSVVERLPDTRPKEGFFLRAIRIQWSKEVFFGMMLLIFSLINSQEKENPQLMFWKKFAQRCLTNFIDELVVVKAWRISTSIFIRESLQRSRNISDFNTCLPTGHIKSSSRPKSSTNYVCIHTVRAAKSCVCGPLETKPRLNCDWHIGWLKDYISDVCPLTLF